MKLNCIDGRVFPLPHNNATSQAQTLQQHAVETPSRADSHIAVSNLMKYNLRPAARVNTVESADQELSVSHVQAELRTGQHSAAGLLWLLRHPHFLTLRVS